VFRRLGLVLLVAGLVIVPGSIYVLRRPDVFRAVASIRIEPPSFDERFASLVPHSTIGQTGRESQERYVPNRMAELRGRRFAELAAASPELHLAPEAIEDVVETILQNLSTRRHAESNTFDVYLEWTDRARVPLLLNALLSVFSGSARSESQQALDNSRQYASQTIATLRKSLQTLDGRLDVAIRQTPVFTPDGKNYLQDQYVTLTSVLATKRIHGDELIQQQRLSQVAGHGAGGRAHPYQARIDQLTSMKARYTEQLMAMKRISKNFNSDPASQHYAKLLDQTMDELEELQNLAMPEEADLVSMFQAHHDEEVRKLEREVKGLQEQIQTTMPQYQGFLGMLEERKQLQLSIADMEVKLREFEFLSQTQNEPVKVLQSALEPNVPVRPNRVLLLGVVGMLGLGLGVGLVCLLETFDRRIKQPEQLSAGLGLPILGTIPRLRRLARLSRGGHLCGWLDPYSPEADAYRNLRASVLGSQRGAGSSASTVLVTSARPSEGKSTTALNLAAACARSGERTLLLEVDLRRPSLGPVFTPDANVGLVDVLAGDLPWTEAICETDVPNLDCLPCGDPSGIPLEALGTIEMHELLAGLARRYHRIVLDGPAVLGLADCRLLGRLVDAAILVVRCGAHDLGPLRRARTMLELSSVPILGAVFNGAQVDPDEWTCPRAAASIAGGAGRGLTYETTTSR
jgi:capsular exopolysaccharide synthesis family protein